VTEQAAEAAEAAVPSMDMADLLTVDGFDMTKVSEMIDASDLDVLQKTALKTSIEQAQNNPELLTQALETAKSALGM
jgi:hypothetical protein